MREVWSDHPGRQLATPGLNGCESGAGQRQVAQTQLECHLSVCGTPKRYQKREGGREGEKEGEREGWRERERKRGKEGK